MDKTTDKKPRLRGVAVVLPEPMYEYYKQVARSKCYSLRGYFRYLLSQHYEKVIEEEKKCETKTSST